MNRHRTTARGIAFLIVIFGLFSAGAVAAPLEAGAAPDLPCRRRRDVHRRLRPAARRRTAPGERPDGRAPHARRRGRGREGEVLDDVVERRLHALSLRRQRHDVPLHPPEQRPDREERQPRQVRRRNVVRAGDEERDARRRRPARRLRRRLGRRERHPPAPALRGAPERRRGGRPVQVPAQGDSLSSSMRSAERRSR